MKYLVLTYILSPLQIKEEKDAFIYLQYPPMKYLGIHDHTLNECLIEIQETNDLSSHIILDNGYGYSSKFSQANHSVIISYIVQLDMLDMVNKFMPFSNVKSDIKKYLRGRDIEIIIS